MKKLIFKIIVALVLVFGLVTNFVINTPDSYHNADLIAMIKANKAQAEDGGYVCLPTSNGCPRLYNGYKLYGQ